MAKNTKIHIALLSYPGAQRAAIYGLEDLFGTANRVHAENNEDGPQLVVRICESLFEVGSNATTVIVPPSLSSPPILENPSEIKKLKKLHTNGALLCSVCAGAFMLASAGLLDGREATTHWALVKDFERHFPGVDLNPDMLVVDDGDIMTAGGIMAWTDLGLKLVDRYLGPTTMLETARFLLVAPGGREQRFYSTFSPSLAHGDEQILAVQHYLQKSFCEPTTVTDMADKAGMSKRTFIRRFQHATTLNPSEYLQHLRIGQARKLIEGSRQSVDQIAWNVGYTDTSAFRKVFYKLVGLTPKEYRNRFTLAGDAK